MRNMDLYNVPSTRYNVPSKVLLVSKCTSRIILLPQLHTWYFVLGTVNARNTGLEISNAERRILNEEVAIRGPSEFVLLLDTNYLLLFLMSNAECRILIEE